MMEIATPSSTRGLYTPTILGQEYSAVVKKVLRTRNPKANKMKVAMPISWNATDDIKQGLFIRNYHDRDVDWSDMDAFFRGHLIGWVRYLKTIKIAKLELTNGGTTSKNGPELEFSSPEGFAIMLYRRFLSEMCEHLRRGERVLLLPRSKTGHLFDIWADIERLRASPSSQSHIEQTGLLSAIAKAFCTLPPQSVEDEMRSQYRAILDHLVG